LQDQGADTVEANLRLGFDADLRNYVLPVSILQYFALERVRFLSNNPEKIAALERAGIMVVERVPAVVAPQEYADNYLRTKRDKMGHLLDIF
jgi:GTP cyclohydrolase II